MICLDFIKSTNFMNFFVHFVTFINLNCTILSLFPAAITWCGITVYVFNGFTLRKIAMIVVRRLSRFERICKEGSGGLRTNREGFLTHGRSLDWLCIVSHV